MSSLPFFSTENHHHHHHHQTNTALKHCWVVINFWVFGGGRKLDRVAIITCLAFLILLTVAYYTTVYSPRTYSTPSISDSPTPAPLPSNSSEAGYGSVVWDYFGSFWESVTASDDVSPTEPWENNRDYAVVIDAGSSGSRVQVYSWKSHVHSQILRKQRGLSLDVLPGVERGVEHGENWQSKVEHGISNFGSHPDDVGAHLKPLLDFALTVIPKTSVETTPVYLMATAGMRLLPKEQQAAVLWATCRYMKSNYPFVLSDCETHVKVISGEMEGIYGWIAVNYLLGGFDDARRGDNANLLDAAAAENHSPGTGLNQGSTGVPGVRHTYGFLDMGGASTQIAFEPAKDVAAEHADDLTTVKLQTLSGREISHQVFVTTFLGFGSNEARRRYVESLIASSVNASLNTTTEQDEIRRANAPGESHNADVKSLMLEDPCLPRDLVLENAPHKLIGEGSFKRCLAILLPLLNKDVPCPTQPCLFNGVHTPSVDFSAHSFVGISEYWYSSNDILGLGGVYDFYRFERASDKFCSTSWPQLESDLAKGNVYGPEVHLDRLQMQCFKSAWIANVLHEGLGVPRVVDPAADVGGPKVVGGNQRPPLFQSVNSIQDIQVSWTLGAVLLHASKNVTVPDELVNIVDVKDKTGRLKITVNGILPKVILLVLVAGAVVIFIVRRRRNGRSVLPTYQPYQRPGDDLSALRSSKYSFRFFLKKGTEVLRKTRISVASLVAPKGTRIVTVGGGGVGGGGGSPIAFSPYTGADVELDSMILQPTEHSDRRTDDPLDPTSNRSKSGPVRSAASLPKYSYNRKRRGDVPDHPSLNAVQPHYPVASAANGSTATTATLTGTPLPSSSSSSSPAFQSPSSTLPQSQPLQHVHRPTLALSLLSNYSSTISSSRPLSPSPWSTNNVKPRSPALWSNAATLTQGSSAVISNAAERGASIEEDVPDGEVYTLRRSHSSGGK